MKKNIFRITLLSSFILAFLCFTSCSEDTTPSTTELLPASLPAPVITSIDPPSGALAGVTKLTINGSNFSSSKENNKVFFSGKPGTVISATPTQLEVISAVIISDSVLTKVAVAGADNFSNIYVYQLNPAVSEFYPFNNALSEFPYAVTVDNFDNVYVSLSSKGIKKINNQGQLTDFAPKGPETFFRSITFASDNAIYAVRGGIKGVYKVAENTAPAAFVASSQGIADNVNSINFDETRNVLWAGGSTGILYRIKLDKNVKKYNLDGGVNALKVAGNSLYVASTTDKELIWKMDIISADSLGTPVLYFDLSTQIDSLIKVIDIVVAQDGDLYLGTNKTSDPIYVIHPDKSFEELYPGVIESEVYSLAWGNSNFLYMTNIINNVHTTILKINMQKLGL